MNEPATTPAPEPASIDEAIATLQKLKAEGVTHLFARNGRGVVEEVLSIGPGRTVYDDGARIGVLIEGKHSPGTGPRDYWGR